MLTRTVALFSFGLAAILFGAAQTEAQPGKGFGKGPKGPESSSDIQKLEKDLNRLLDQVKETQAQLERMKESAGKKGSSEKGKGFEGKGKGGFEGRWKGGFEGKGPFGGKDGFPGKGPGGFGPRGEKGPPKMDPETIKQKYEYYKGLYKESQRDANRGKGKGGKGGPKGKQKPDSTPTRPTQGKNFGGGGGGSSSVEARIDRLIRELEELRSEVKGGKKK